jgi:hypothetical protein
VNPRSLTFRDTFPSSWVAGDVEDGRLGVDVAEPPRQPAATSATTTSGSDRNLIALWTLGAS